VEAEPIDKASLDKWDDYTRAKEQMFFETDTADSPWTVVKSDCKKRARLNAMRYVLHKLPYNGKALDQVGKLDPLIVGRAHVVYERGEKPQVGFAGVFPLLRFQEIDLPAARGQGARVFSPNAHQNQFGDVAKVETDPSSIGAAVFAYLVPDQVGLVGEAPCVHDRQSFRKQGVGHPQVQMGGVRRDLFDGQGLDVVQGHGSEYRFSRRCSGATLPVRFWNCQGGSARMRGGTGCRSMRAGTGSSSAERAMVEGFIGVFSTNSFWSNAKYEQRATAAAATVDARQQLAHVGRRRAKAAEPRPISVEHACCNSSRASDDDADTDRAKLEQEAEVVQIAIERTGLCCSTRFRAQPDSSKAIDIVCWRDRAWLDRR
jgi:hypothetical protein